MRRSKLRDVGSADETESTAGAALDAATKSGRPTPRASAEAAEMIGHAIVATGGESAADACNEADRKVQVVQVKPACPATFQKQIEGKKPYSEFERNVARRHPSSTSEDAPSRDENPTERQGEEATVTPSATTCPG